MQCLKCGRKTEEQQVFCKDCLQAVSAYPISPTAVVHIPQRPTAPVKLSYQKEHSDTDTIAQMRVTIRWLTATVAVLSVLLCLLAGMLFYNLNKQPEQNIGRNYSTAGTETTP